MERAGTIYSKSKNVISGDVPAVRISSGFLDQIKLSLFLILHVPRRASESISTTYLIFSFNKRIILITFILFCSLLLIRAGSNSIGLFICSKDFTIFQNKLSFLFLNKHILPYNRILKCQWYFSSVYLGIITHNMQNKIAQFLCPHKKNYPVYSQIFSHNFFKCIELSGEKREQDSQR